MAPDDDPDLGRLDGELSNGCSAASCSARRDASSALSPAVGRPRAPSSARSSTTFILLVSLIAAHGAWRAGVARSEKRRHGCG